jgi:signal peptidase II
MKKRYIIIVIILILLDQLSKYFIVSNFNVYDELIIIKNFFKLEYVQNTGISFGLFSGGRIIIILASLAVIGFMIYDLLHEESRIHNFSCILILSGAFGNLIDRVFRGYVVDFISFTIMNHKMGIFNLADICFVSGIVLYILLMFLVGRK